MRVIFFFFSSRRRHTRFDCDWSSDVCSSDLIEGEFGVGKPEEIVYRHALRALGAPPEEAWMAGDHLEFDVEAPQRLGLHGVWIDRAGHGLPAGSRVRPHRVVRSLRELVEAPG